MKNFSTLFLTFILFFIASCENDGQIDFAVIGDYGDNSQAEKQVSDLVKSWKPDFIITTGDNNYPTGSRDTIDLNIGQYYSDYIFPYNGNYTSSAKSMNFFPCLGNHDWDSAELAKPYLDYFELPNNERYYDIVKGPIHFFILDSDPREPDGIKSNSLQATWLKAQLAQSSSPWKIIVFHHPPYSSSSVHGSTPDLQWPFKQWGASLVLSGHDHTYERLSQDDLTYVVNGLGGAPKYVFGAPVSQSIKHYNTQFGAMKISASSKILIADFETIDRKIEDHFELSR